MAAKAPYKAVLELDADARRDYAQLIGMLRREWSLDSTADIVLRALREAAQRS